MGWPVLVFDIETIPDVAGMRAVGLGQPAETSALPAGGGGHFWPILACFSPYCA